MKPSEIIKLARRQTGCTEDIVTIDEAYKFLNFVIEDFGSEIRVSDSGYGFDVLGFDVNAGQPSYTFESDNETGTYSSKFPISKIQSVWLLDQNTGKYRDLPVHFVDKVDVNKFEDPGEPRACFITRTELNLIPAPKTSTNMQIWGWNYNQPIFQDIWTITVNGHDYVRSPNEDVAGTPYPYAWRYDTNVIYTDSEKPTTGTAYANAKGTATAGSISDYDVEVFDSEENIWIDKRWHYVIVEGLKYWMYGNMGVNFETARNNCRAFYDSEKNKAIQNIVDRGQLADTAYFPNLNFLNY